MGTHGWAYRRRQPEGTVLYEAVRDNLATLLAEANEVWRGLPRYVERDFARYLEVRGAGARVRAGTLRELQGRAISSPSHVKGEGCAPPATRSGRM